MENTCRLAHITYRENNRGPSREEYKVDITTIFFYATNGYVCSKQRLYHCRILSMRNEIDQTLFDIVNNNV